MDGFPENRRRIDMETLTRLRDGYWRQTSKRTPVEKDFVLGMFNEGSSIWVFRCFEDRGYVPVCASGTTQSDAIYVSDFSWLPYPESNEWRTDVPPDQDAVVGIRRGSVDPEMLVYVFGQFLSVDIEYGTDDDSEVVDCIKWIDLPSPPAPRTKKAKKLALRHVN